MSGQLELAELDASRTRLMEAEVRALRAQISPHFIYNSLGAIASFTRTDPDRPKHGGLTMFVVDMHAPGVTVRPLRQMGADRHAALDAEPLVQQLAEVLAVQVAPS